MFVRYKKILFYRLVEGVVKFKWVVKTLTVKKKKKKKNIEKTMLKMSIIQRILYENNKEKLQEEVRNPYRNLSKGEQNIKRELWRNRYKNMPEEDKQN